MSHASQTLHYNLPIYEGTDIINPLTDVNGTNEAVDEAMYNIASSAATAIQTAQEVKEEIEGTGGVDSRISALVTRMDAVETKNVEQDTSILGVQQAIQTTNGNVTTNTQNISDLNSTVQGHTTSIQNLGTRVQGCENADAALDVRVTALENSPAATVDTAMSSTSTNAVQNKVIKEYVDDSIADYEEVQTASMAIGATTATLTFTKKTIGATSLVKVFSSKYGVVPKNVTTTSNTVVLTFDALEEAITAGASVR